jgi:acetyl-CoA carboxylase biotin carboxyl carrier protein
MSPSFRLKVYDSGEDQQGTTEIPGGLPMSCIQQEDVLLILKLLDESPFDELQVETEGLKIWASKHGRGISPPLSATIEATPKDGQEPDPSAAKSAGSKGEAQLPEQTLEQSALHEGLMPITAPMLGTFYRTPKPGAPPYVEVGSVVNQEDPVCIIEVMKLFNTVKAGVRGRIIRICAEQGQMVEFKQNLFLVEKIHEEKDPAKASPE